jgi:putative transposase
MFTNDSALQMTNETAQEERDWEEACRREDAIRALLNRRTSSLAAKEVEETAVELGLSRATLYRMIRLYRDGGTVSSLLPRSVGRPKKSRSLAPECEALIAGTIRRFYLKPEKPKFSRLVQEVRLRCLEAGFAPANWRTIKSRVEDLDVRIVAQRRKDEPAIKATKATPHHYIATQPLAIVQIDHTRVDVVVVDEETGEPIGRPWITLAIDVFTRMVAGFHLTMAAPSRLSTGLALLHAVHDKSVWLKEREIEAPWPVAGLPETLHADNGSDFRSRAFVRACRDSGIKIIWRIPGEPHYGGHIERLIGTMMGAVRLLPGTTHGSPAAKGDYKSDKAARLTLRELERWIGHEIAGRYHNSIHSALKRPPIAVWLDHEATVQLRMPVDRMAFWVAFLPEQERTLRPDGIHLFGLTYWSSVLTADVGRLKRKLLVKYDPRDLSRIFVLRASGHFIEARYGDITLAPISLHEAQSAARALAAKGRREVDSRTLVKTAIAQRELVRGANRRTLELKGKIAKTTGKKVGDGDLGSLRGIDSRTRIPSVEGDA